MSKKYDVVIVGAGPAGLMAAKTAAESGLKIVLLERQSDISKVCRTDGGVVALNEYTFGQVTKFNRKTQALVFPVSGFSVKYDGSWNDNLYGFHFYSPGGKRFMVGDFAKLRKNPEKNSRGLALSKGLLLKGILSEVRALGVEYLPDTNVVGVSTTSDGASVESSRGDFKGRFVVAADGINSRIVRLLGLNKKRKFIGTMRDLAWTMKGVRNPDPEGLIFIFTMYGTFSIMPICHKDHSHVGILTYDPKMDLTPLLERFTRDDPVFSPWFKGAKRVSGTESCVVNVWQAIEKPYFKNVILLGDACWSQEFSNMAALTAGYQLGHALTKAFIDEKFNEKGLAQYMEWYDTYCYKPHGLEELGGGGSITDYLTSEELDYLAVLPGKPAPHTMSFYEVFRRIFQTYGPLTSRIKKERPGIMKKLKKMETDREKAVAGRKKAGFANR
jgi:flavin-dependent dehydrogenase